MASDVGRVPEICDPRHRRAHQQSAANVQDTVGGTHNYVGATINIDGGTVNVGGTTDVDWNFQGGDVSFPSTGDKAVQPASVLILPTITVTGAPTWTGTAGELVVNNFDCNMHYWCNGQWNTLLKQDFSNFDETLLPGNSTPDTSNDKLIIWDGGTGTVEDISLLTFLQKINTSLLTDNSTPDTTNDSLIIWDAGTSTNQEIPLLTLLKKIDVTLLTALTPGNIVTTTDLVTIWDNDVSENKKVTVEDFLDPINLTEKATPTDISLDYIPYHDSGTTAPKRISMEDLGTALGAPGTDAETITLGGTPTLTVAPKLFVVDVDHTDIDQPSVTTFDLALFTLPARGVIMHVVMHLTEAVTMGGGGISLIGYAKDQNDTTAFTDDLVEWVGQSVGTTRHQPSGPFPWMKDDSATEVIEAQFDADVNLDNVTAGHWKIYFLMYQLP